MTSREAFEAWYVESCPFYTSAPIGSRDCTLQWKAWQARDAEIAYAEQAIAAERARADALTKENDTLRGLLGNSAKPCMYCGLAAEDQAKCAHGFPGCPRGDDQILSKHFADGYAAEQDRARADALEAALRELVALKDLKERLESVPGAALSMNEWISVKDRLPDDPTQMCLVVWGWPNPRREIAWLRIRWKGQLLWDGMHGSHDSVTHWMPIPDPPSGSRE